MKQLCSFGRCWAPAAGQEGPGLERLEEATAPDILQHPSGQGEILNVAWTPLRRKPWSSGGDGVDRVDAARGGWVPTTPWSSTLG